MSPRLSTFHAACVGSALFVSVLLATVPAGACGPYPYYLEASYPYGPEDPEIYVAGALGLIQADWDERELWIAYRHLRGLSVPADPLLLKGLDHRWMEPRADHDEVSDPHAAWREARRRFASIVPWEHDPRWTERTTLVRSGAYEYHYYFDNCLDDGFRHALQTWQARAQTYGAESREVAEWVRGQDLVFANCEQGEHLPEPLDASWPLQLRQDRDYQIAAAHFYAGRAVDAAALFRAIAADPRAERRDLADYLVARALARAGHLPAAVEHLETLLDDPPGPFDDAARGLFTHLLYRSDPERFLRRVTERLAAADLPSHDKPRPWRPSPLDQDLEDLSFALGWQRGVLLERRRETLDPQFVGPPQSTWPPLAADATEPEDLRAWIQVLRRRANPWGEPPDLDELITHAETTGQVHWWLAAAVIAEPRVSEDGPTTRCSPQQAGRLLDLAPDPAVVTPAAAFAVDYHRLRLRAELEPTDPALPELLAALAARAPTQSDRNRIALTRARLAPDLATFVEWSVHRPAAAGWEFVQVVQEETLQPEEKAVLFPDAVAALNAASPQVLLDLARSPALPEPQRARLSAVGWVRALVLGRRDLLMEHAPVLADYVPALKNDLTAWPDLPPAEQDFAAALLVLKAPGFEPYVHHAAGWVSGLTEGPFSTQSWWCAGILAAPSTRTDVAGDGARWLSGLGDDGGAELPAAVPFLGPTILKFAEQNPADSRVPEALHRLVRATRYGCGSGHGEISRTAFRLLHRRYPESEWTRRTPYWFD